MKPSEKLRHDHEVLREKLALLEQYLPSFQTAPLTIVRMADSLAHCLQLHNDLEERLLSHLASARENVPVDVIEHLHCDHQGQQLQLAMLYELLSQDEPMAFEEQVMAQASYFLDDLREHMTLEEVQLFPVLDRRNAFADIPADDEPENGA